MKKKPSPTYQLMIFATALLLSFLAFFNYQEKQEITNMTESLSAVEPNETSSDIVLNLSPNNVTSKNKAMNTDVSSATTVDETSSTTSYYDMEFSLSGDYLSEANRGIVPAPDKTTSTTKKVTTAKETTTTTKKVTTTKKTTTTTKKPTTKKTTIKTTTKPTTKKTTIKTTTKSTTKKTTTTNKITTTTINSSKRVVIDADLLNVRLNPDSTSSIIGTVKKNSVYVFSQTKTVSGKKWYFIRISSSRWGWVVETYVHVADVKSLTTTTTVKTTAKPTTTIKKTTTTTKTATSNKVTTTTKLTTTTVKTTVKPTTTTTKSTTTTTTSKPTTTTTAKTTVSTTTTTSKPTTTTTYSEPEDVVVNIG